MYSYTTHAYTRFKQPSCNLVTKVVVSWCQSTSKRNRRNSGAQNKRNISRSFLTDCMNVVLMTFCILTSAHKLRLLFPLCNTRFAACNGYFYTTVGKPVTIHKWYSVCVCFQNVSIKSIKRWFYDTLYYLPYLIMRWLKYSTHLMSGWSTIHLL